MHSDKSADDKEWSEKLHRADLVLNVEDIKKLAPQLGPGVVMKEIPDGKHDLTLSLDTPRELCLETMVEWAGKLADGRVEESNDVADGGRVVPAGTGSRQAGPDSMDVADRRCLQNRAGVDRAVGRCHPVPYVMGSGWRRGRSPCRACAPGEITGVNLRD